MAIERMSKPNRDLEADWLVTCDEKGCKQCLDSKGKTFNDTVAFIKESRWKIRKLYSTWLHYCPTHH